MLHAIEPLHEWCTAATQTNQKKRSKDTGKSAAPVTFSGGKLNELNKVRTKKMISYPILCVEMPQHSQYYFAVRETFLPIRDPLDGGQVATVRRRTQLSRETVPEARIKGEVCTKQSAHVAVIRLYFGL